MSNTSPEWFGSDERANHCADIASIPAWRRFLLCFLSYDTWKLARSLDKAAIHMLVEDEDESFDRTLRLADTQWAKVFNIKNRSRLPREQ